MSIVFEIIIVGSVIWFVVRWTGRAARRKQEDLFNEKTSPAATVRDRCMVRECSMEEPGVAQVLDGNLCIHTVTGKDLVIPMSQVKLTKVWKNIFLIYLVGRYPWWGKTRLWLETPRTNGLVLGVDDPLIWLQVFKDEC